MDSPQNIAGRVTGHLVLRDLKRGAVWYAKTRVPSRDPEQTMRKLAPAHVGGGRPRNGAMTRRQAEDTLADMLAAERRKVGERGYDYGPARFADVAADYLHHVEHVRGRRASTVSDYRGSIENYLNPRWGEWSVDTITTEDVEALRDELIPKMSPRTVVRHLTVAHSIFKYAVRKHGLTRNPAGADVVDRPTVSYSGEFKTLTIEQLAALIRAAEHEQDGVLYLTAAQSGLRQGELRALAVADVDFAVNRIHVRRSAAVGSNAEIHTPKSGKVRSVPMTPDVAMALARLLQREHFTGPDDLVFGNIVGEVENDTLLRRRYFKALERAELPQVRFHDLRHAFGSNAVKTFPISDVQAMLGHAHISTTSRYIHHIPGVADGDRLAEAFRILPVSPTGDIEQNSEKQSDRNGGE